MGTWGSFAYCYDGEYYRQLFWHDAYPWVPGRGQMLVDTVPRNPSAFKGTSQSNTVIPRVLIHTNTQDWVTDRIKMLKNARIGDEEVDHPSDGGDADGLSFELVHNEDWTYSRWTYVIDLDNLCFTVNGTVDFDLHDLPLYLDDFPFDDLDYNEGHRSDFWPPPSFNTEESRQNYDALQPIIVPANEWPGGALDWDDLSISQQFSIQISDHLLHRTSGKFDYAYVPFIRSQIGAFCWNLLCASVPALPLFRSDDFEDMHLSSQTLLPGYDNCYARKAYHEMHSLADGGSPKLSESKSIEYFWVRGCLVTFCLRLAEPIYVAHEVEKMVRKMRLDGPTESVGIILSSQQELVVVAVDGPQVRHSPVLTIRTTGETPERASDGRLILTYLLSPPCTNTPLPWRIIQSRQSSPTCPTSVAALPSEVLRTIVHQVDMNTYLALCRVSRSFRSICVANPRVACYTVLHKVAGFETFFAARSTADGTLKTIALMYWRSGYDYSDSHWNFREVSSEEIDKLRLKLEDSYIYTRDSLFDLGSWKML